MPGFFMSFLLLAAEAAWFRYLAETRGPRWLAYATLPALALCLLAMVFSAATLSGGPPDVAGLASEEADRILMEATHARLMRVHYAAGVAQWATIVTTVVGLGLTGWAWSRPTLPQEVG